MSFSHQWFHICASHGVDERQRTQYVTTNTFHSHSQVVWTWFIDFAEPVFESDLLIPSSNQICWTQFRIGLADFIFESNPLNPFLSRKSDDLWNKMMDQQILTKFIRWSTTKIPILKNDQKLYEFPKKMTKSAVNIIAQPVDSQLRCLPRKLVKPFLFKMPLLWTSGTTHT